MTRLIHFSQIQHRLVYFGLCTIPFPDCSACSRMYGSISYFVELRAYYDFTPVIGTGSKLYPCYEFNYLSHYKFMVHLRHQYKKAKNTVALVMKLFLNSTLFTRLTIRYGAVFHLV